jgi:hypothetical protein
VYPMACWFHLSAHWLLVLRRKVRQTEINK